MRSAGPKRMSRPSGIFLHRHRRGRSRRPQQNSCSTATCQNRTAFSKAARQIPGAMAGREFFGGTCRGRHTRTRAAVRSRCGRLGYRPRPAPARFPHTNTRLLITSPRSRTARHPTGCVRWTSPRSRNPRCKPPRAGRRPEPSPHRLPPLAERKRDWAFASRALDRGEDPAAIKQRIASFRPDKHNPADYAERTVEKAQAHRTQAPPRPPRRGPPQ